jgi:4-alpha-glucanotransferase
MTPEIEALRDSIGLPGMRILQYGFGGDPHDLHLPHNYVKTCVAYTGTHDNETVAGWYQGADRATRKRCRKYLASNGRAINWDMIRGALSSVADTAIVPVQDVLGLGNEARMNTPAGWGPNWQWRLQSGELHDELVDKLRDMTEIYGRLP